MRDYHDLPRKELMEAANRAMENHAASEPVIYFKFTCGKCGERCVLAKANTLYEYGECYKCGHETKILKGGFALHLNLRPHEKFT